MTLIAGPVDAWRIFSIDGTTLAGPFASWLWPHLLSDADQWQPGPNVARCLLEQHRAPSPGCACGIYGTRDLSALLEYGRAPQMHTGSTVLEHAGVVARLLLAGAILPSEDPADPRGTVRGSVGKLLELWVAPTYADRLTGLHDRYGLPAQVAASWDAVAPLPRLERAVTRLRLGIIDGRTPDGARALLSLADGLVTGLTGGMTRTDGAVALFDTPAEPSLEQARAFVATVVRIMMPHRADEPDGYLASAPPTLSW